MLLLTATSNYWLQGTSKVAKWQHADEEGVTHQSNGTLHPPRQLNWSTSARWANWRCHGGGDEYINSPNITLHNITFGRIRAMVGSCDWLEQSAVLHRGLILERARHRRCDNKEVEWGAAVWTQESAGGRAKEQGPALSCGL